MILFHGMNTGKTEIKNIIFDWGGVITDLNIDASRKAFRDLGLSLFDKWMPQEPMEHIFLPFEIGMISADEFRDRLRPFSPQILTDDMIDAAWNSMLGDLPAERWKILQDAQKNYRTFLLSNTNAIHVEYYSRFLQGIYGTYGYRHLFEKTYFSFEVHMRKPNRDIFEFVIRDGPVEPAHSLFIDDSPDNIETARALGFQTALLKAPQTLADLFTNHSL